MTGFRGRMGLYELLVVTEAFKDRVSREPQMEALRKQAGWPTACARCAWPGRPVWPRG